MSISNSASTWLRYSGQVVLGLLAGAILTIVCVAVAAPFLFTVAVAVGPVLAFVIYLVAVIIGLIRSRGRGMNAAWVRFFVGMCAVPAYATVILIDWLISSR